MRSNGYIFAFAAAVCAVCGIVVAGSAVSLKDRQDANQRLDKQKKVLSVAGLLAADEEVTPDEVQKRFSCVGGKAAPGYYRAKSIIKLINNIAKVTGFGL